MDIIKPEPLRLGDRYYYTLTSYDPVSIEVRVPRVIDADVEIALGQLVAEREAAKAEDGTLPEVPQLTDEWVAAEYPDVGTVANLRESVRRQLEQLNSQAAEDSKGHLCAQELAKRLGQRVPEAEVDQLRAMLQQQMAADLAREGLTVSDFMRQAGFGQMSLDRMLDEQAKSAAEQDAALDAFAQERKLKVEDGELPTFLGVPFAQAQQAIDEARSRGQLEAMRAMAVRLKAMRTLVAECSCTYVQESLEEAEERAARYRELVENAADVLGRGESAGEDEGPGFKLVD